MSEKRFYCLTHNLNEDDEYYEIIDKAQRHSFNFIKDEWLATQVCDYLNEQQNIINEQNELIKLIADACTYSKEHSVKEILRKEIRGIDTVTEESANAWHDYVILSKFFEEHYKEDWDDEI